jgi:hypothetical protein
MRNLGVLEWGGGRDMEMNRNYYARFLVETDDEEDGPQQVTFAPDLPTIGSSWNIGNDYDAGARCTPIVDCESVIKNESNFWWILKYNFTTKPWKVCATNPFISPLSNPDVISGSFGTYQEDTCQRYDGSIILSSSLEPVWTQKDLVRPTVNITQTRLNLELNLFAPMINTLNSSPLWGLSARCIKLRNVAWRRMVWGVCTFYYERTLEFDIRYDTFDLYKVVDMGHRVVDPKLVAANPSIDRTNLANFTRARDPLGNPVPYVLLDGYGSECTDPYNHRHVLTPPIQLYGASNFLALGVPVTL